MIILGVSSQLHSFTDHAHVQTEGGFHGHLKVRTYTLYFQNVSQVLVWSYLQVSFSLEVSVIFRLRAATFSRWRHGVFDPENCQNGNDHIRILRVSSQYCKK